MAIIDVDTGLVVTTRDVRSGDDARATSTARARSNAASTQLPLRPRQYVLRLTITDDHLLASYDQVTAGPRFAVSGRGKGVENLADEDDGLVSLPFTFQFPVPADGAS